MTEPYPACRVRKGPERGSRQSSKNPSDASQRPSKDIPAFADFDRPMRRGSLALPAAPRRDESPADDVRHHALHAATLLVMWHFAYSGIPGSVLPLHPI